MQRKGRSRKNRKLKESIRKLFLLPYLRYIIFLYLDDKMGDEDQVTTPSANVNNMEDSSSTNDVDTEIAIPHSPPWVAQVAAADNATEKRETIQAIMRDTTLTDLEKRLRIQRLMDGSAAKTDSQSSTGQSMGSGINLLLPGLRESIGIGLSGGGSQSSTGEEVVACVHYERKCNVVAPCCGVAFGCRVCHDEMNIPCGPMDRFAIKEVVCKECNTRQSSATNACLSCGVTFAEWHCPRCNLWMALNKRPFHCDECGICRVGGIENFRHCAKCCMCISISVYDTHNCIKDKYKNNCPVCRDDMFSSRQPPQDLPCGHAIHAHCFRNLAGFDYRCPICKKTVVSRTSMAAAWQARARDIELQPMPEDLARVVNIICNDCEKKSLNCSWHFLGVQCSFCKSFNTVVEQIVSNAHSLLGNP